jgi:negative regulator of genetic competence, sporulation and motility
MDSLFRLTNIDAKFKGITVSHDMTKDERDDCKKLVDETKQKENYAASGEWTFRVRGLPGQLRVISIKKK